jgi:hypothetical protein
VYRIIDISGGLSTEQQATAAEGKQKKTNKYYFEATAIPWHMPNPLQLAYDDLSGQKHY